MAHAFHLDIVSVEDELFSGEASLVVLPGEAGELGICAHHASLLTRIKPGMVTIHPAAGGAQLRLFVAGGVVEVSGNRVTVLADHAVRTPELDEAKAEDARREAHTLRARFGDTGKQPGFDFAAAKSELVDELRRFFMLALHRTTK